MSEALDVRKKFITAAMYMCISISAVALFLMMEYAFNKVVIVSAEENEAQTEEVVLLQAPSGSWKMDLESEDALGSFYIPVGDYITYDNVEVYERPDEGTVSFIFKDVDPAAFLYSKAHGDFTNVLSATGTYNDDEVMLTFDVTPHSEVKLSYIKKEMCVTIAPYSLRDVPIVIVDASYGGSANGNLVGNVAEKDITLRLAKTLRTMAQDKPYRIVLTRTMDVTMNTKTRLAFMENIGADYYIGLRLSANVDDTKQYGLVAKYNDVYYRDGMENVSFAENMLKNTAESSSDRAIALEPVGEDSVIISALSIPAVDLYAGFLTNSDECALLQTDRYLEQIANGILATLDEVME